MFLSCLTFLRPYHVLPFSVCVSRRSLGLRRENTLSFFTVSSRLLVRWVMAPFSKCKIKQCTGWLMLLIFTSHLLASGLQHPKENKDLVNTASKQFDKIFVLFFALFVFWFFYLDSFIVTGWVLADFHEHSVVQSIIRHIIYSAECALQHQMFHVLTPLQKNYLFKYFLHQHFFLYAKCISIMLKSCILKHHHCSGFPIKK